MARTIPLYTLEGVPDCDITTHNFSTGDKLGLSMLRFNKAPCRDVVMIVHGLTTSTDMFIMPEHEKSGPLFASQRPERRLVLRFPNEQSAPL